MQRYFVDKIDIKNKTAQLSSSDFHHIRNVMRNKQNDEIIVCNNQGVCFISKIVFLDDTKKEVSVSLIDEIPSNELPVNVTLAQGLIRREKFEYVLQKTTELGVHNIIPVQSKHSIIKLSDKEDKKVERWNKITKEASEQSHRSHLVCVKDIKNSFKEIDYSQYDQVLVAYERENNSNELASVFTKRSKNLLLVIGPEGGLHESEINFFKTLSNVFFVGLGKRILRSETASTYLLSTISYNYEILGDLQ